MACGGDKVFLTEDADSESDSPSQSGDNVLTQIRDLLIDHNSQPTAAEPKASGSEAVSLQSHSGSIRSSNTSEHNLRQALDLLANYLDYRDINSIPSSDVSRLFEILHQLIIVDKNSSFSHYATTSLSRPANAPLEGSGSTNARVKRYLSELSKLAPQRKPTFAVKKSSESF